MAESAKSARPDSYSPLGPRRIRGIALSAVPFEFASGMVPTP